MIFRSASWISIQVYPQGSDLKLAVNSLNNKLASLTLDILSIHLFLCSIASCNLLRRSHALFSNPATLPLPLPCPLSSGARALHHMFLRGGKHRRLFPQRILSYLATDSLARRSIPDAPFERLPLGIYHLSQGPTSPALAPMVDQA